MRLSILTPSYGYGRFLDDALLSVREQETELEIEHIVMDGGSTDETVSVLERAPGLVWRSEPDRGQSHALNKALDLATGDWIGWLNVDEFYLPGAFSALQEVLLARPDVDLVHGDAVFVNGDGSIRRLVAQHRPSMRVLRWYGPYISTCSMFVRRSSIRAEGLDEGLKTIMDWDLQLDIMNSGGRLAYVPQAFAAFRVHADQVTAEPLPKDDPERFVVADRHGLPAVGSRWVGLAGAMGRLEHMLLKLGSGAYRRQVCVRKWRGSDLRWFGDDEARRVADAVRGGHRPS